MDNVEKIRIRITNYIQENSFVNHKKLDENTLIFEEGIFDSMGFVLLIDFLEENFSVFTQDEDLIEENFESIKAITQYIQKKQSQAN